MKESETIAVDKRKVGIYPREIKIEIRLKLGMRILDLLLNKPLKYTMNGSVPGSLFKATIQ